MARQYAVTGLVRTVNRVVGVLNRFGLGGRTTYTLTTVGRKSGLARSTPVTIPTVAGRRYLVSPYGDVGWVHNLRASGRASLSRAGRNEDVVVTEVGPEEAGPVLHRYFQDIKIVRPYFDATVDSGVDAFQAEAHRHPVFRIEGDAGTEHRR